MGGSSSQVVGYRYYAKFAAFIGNRIEKLIAINFDNRKWIIHDPLNHPPNLLPVLEGNLFGENEGGVSGNIDIHFGYPDPEPNAEYQKYFPLVSGYPYQSYLVFRSLTGGAPSLGEGLSPAGFYLGNSGYMKEMLLWVKRIHVRNDGRAQWYDEKAEIGRYLIYFESEEFKYNQPFQLRCKTKIKPSRSSGHESTGDYTWTGVFNESDNMGGSWSIGSSYTSIVYAESPLDFSLIYVFPGVGVVANIIFVMSRSNPEAKWELVGSLVEDPVVEIGTDGLLYISCKFIIPKKGTHHVGIKGTRKLEEEGSTGFGLSITARVFSCYTYTSYGELDAPDINPIHKIREILTDDTAMGKPESDINNINFIKAADRIWNEGLGISWAIDEKSCIDAIEDLCYHIEAGVRVNRQTGLYEMVLFRDDWFSEDEIHKIAENKIKDLSLEVMNSDDIVNQLNVTYYDRARIKNSTFSIYENGSILTMGHANAESIEFPYFMNMRNAEVVANWKLKQFSTPAWSGSFATGWREARKWNRYDLIRLPWSKKWNGTILARIMKINLGDGVNNTVTIDFEEVIPYSGEMNNSIVVDAPVDSGPQPPQPSINAVFEAPYYLTVLRAGQTNADLELSNNPEIGYVAAIAAKPQNNSLNALLYTDGGVGEFEQVSRLDYCDILQLDQSITETTSSFVVTGSLAQAANSNNLILLNGEWMGFVGFDAETKVLTVKRGVLDSGMPKKHTSGSLFIIDLPDVAFDATQYVQGEIVGAQVLTTTPSGIQELSEIGQAVEIQARAIRPYPPANVKINGEYCLELFTNDFEISWANRNRLQQTGGELVGYFESSVMLEQDTQTMLVLTELDINNMQLVTHSANVTALNSFILAESIMQPGTKYIRVSLRTVRDGYECLNPFQHTVIRSDLVAPSNIDFEVIEYV